LYSNSAAFRALGGITAMNKYSFLLLSLCALVFVTKLHAAPFLSSGDFIIGIDTDAPILPSNYPGAEAPINALDANADSKYLNFAKVNSGFIVKPFIGATTVKSIRLTTANDAVERDPLSWQLFGTNSPITSVNNGDGSAENWTLIASNDALLPADRKALGPVQSFSNSTAYSAYRVLFPTVKDAATANSMQIADVGLFQSTDGSGASVWDAFETDLVAFAYAIPDSRSPAAEAVQYLIDGNAVRPSASGYFANEGPANAIDGTDAKYLNFGGGNSGFIVTPASGASMVQSFQLKSANDAADRDPTSWQLFGTNSAISSANNSHGTDESWTLIGSGTVAMPAERNTLGPVVSVPNAANYTSYKLQFPTVNGSNLMQIAEASFFTSTNGSGTDILNPTDPILAFDSDTTLTKYLNFGGENSGFIVTPAAGAKVINQFQITTGDDFPERDPTSYQLYGTNDTVTSAADSTGTAENWVLISSGSLDLPLDRQFAAPAISVTNTTAYKSYRMVFPTLRHGEDPFDENQSLQLTGIQFFDASTALPGDFNTDGKVDGRDLLVWQRNPSVGSLADWKANYGTGGLAAIAVPEPAAIVLIGGCVLGCLGIRRKNRA
jgi:hypothetical protein